MSDNVSLAALAPCTVRITAHGRTDDWPAHMVTISNDCIVVAHGDQPLITYPLSSVTIAVGPKQTDSLNGGNHDTHTGTGS
ncbi:MAG: hypothetical protein JO191_11610 [Mycobacteriaceae bacterium]|nr:hypothetical protein [Mycobacteriaceae bacterium]